MVFFKSFIAFLNVEYQPNMAKLETTQRGREAQPQLKFFQTEIKIGPTWPRSLKQLKTFTYE